MPMCYPSANWSLLRLFRMSSKAVLCQWTWLLPDHVWWRWGGDWRQLRHRLLVLCSQVQRWAPLPATAAWHDACALGNRKLLNFFVLQKPIFLITTRVEIICVIQCSQCFSGNIYNYLWLYLWRLLVLLTWKHLSLSNQDEKDMKMVLTQTASPKVQQTHWRTANTTVNLCNQCNSREFLTRTLNLDEIRDSFPDLNLMILHCQLVKSIGASRRAASSRLNVTP